MTATPLKCLIIGYGYMGEIRRMVIERHPKDLVLLGVVDPNQAIASKVAPYPFWTDYKEALAQKPDVVFVCTPNKFAPEIASHCFKKGIHVFCEKPPGRSVEDIVSIRAAESPKTRLMFGFNHRWHPGIMKAKVLIESGRFGRILNLRGLYGKSGGVSFKKSWRNDKDISGGGILLDQGIHMMDLFRHFAGDFSDVRCFASRAFWNMDVEDNAFVILKGTQGIDAMMHSSATFWKHTFRIDITLEGGYITVEGLLSKSGSYGREQLIVARRQFEDEAHAVGNPSEEITYFDRDLSWDLEVEEFVRCIRENQAVKIASSHDALRVMELIAQAYVNAGLVAPLEILHEKHSR